MLKNLNAINHFLGFCIQKFQGGLFVFVCYKMTFIPQN